MASLWCWFSSCWALYYSRSDSKSSGLVPHCWRSLRSALDLDFGSWFGLGRTIAFLRPSLIECYVLGPGLINQSVFGDPVRNLCFSSVQIVIGSFLLFYLLFLLLSVNSFLLIVWLVLAVFRYFTFHCPVLLCWFIVQSPFVVFYLDRYRLNFKEFESAYWQVLIGT